MHRAPAAARLAACRAQLSDLDIRLTLACERAAGQGQPHRLAPADPASWKPVLWRRYLTEARAQNDLMGPRRRSLRARISRLEAAIDIDGAP